MGRPKEELLHHIWMHRLYSHSGLFTVDGQPLRVVKPGTHNTDSGPDFLQAQLYVKDMLWSGNVEIHVRASDWLNHGHKSDPAYENIILHVVYENDLERSVGNFPTLELKAYISDQVIKRYEGLMGSRSAVPCGNLITDIEPVIRATWLESLLVNRLMRKSQQLEELIDHNTGDLEQTFMTAVFRAFGMKVNADAFEELAAATSWKILTKHQDNLRQLEAILFGNAGLLGNAPKDEYSIGLQKEYAFLKHKYALEPMDSSRWKFLRLRPANFPTVRIAQLAALFHISGPLLAYFTKIDPTNPRLHGVAASSYWNTHYTFGRTSPVKTKQLGDTLLSNLLINVLAPFLMVVAEREQRQELKEQAIDLLRTLKAEQNRKVRPFSELGLKVTDAATTQALIELKTNYCDLRKCLICSIGAAAMRQHPKHVSDG